MMIMKVNMYVRNATNQQWIYVLERHIIILSAGIVDIWRTNSEEKRTGEREWNKGK